MSKNFEGQVQLEDQVGCYDYDLPEELIAQKPVIPRDASRLLVLHRREGRWEHRKFSDLPQYLDPKDLVVANNTRVMKARLLGHRLRFEKGSWVRGGKVEFVLLEELRPRVWEGLFHASAQYVAGLQFEIPIPGGGSLKGTLVRGSAESPAGTVVAEFDCDPLEAGAGQIPLPHYIQRSTELSHEGLSSESLDREKLDREKDEQSYQTIYSKVMGSAAAPTAGLHFTQEVLRDLKSKGIRWEEVTLHVGLGTFRPVKVSDVRQHVMHEERYQVSPETAQSITEWKTAGNRVLAVGTTSVRTLESSWREGRIQSGMNRTSLFIRPGAFQFQVVDRLLTNFHLPKSTLLMLVSAFAGRELTLAAYQDAVQQRYRFFSYGDAMLIL